MYLIAHNSSTGTNHIIRPLSPAEIKFDDDAAPIYFEASNRLGLFSILKENYKAWSHLVQELLAPASLVTPNQREFDRLMFNLLATAYGIIEHFETSFRRRHKKDSSKISEYKSFITQLCKSSWAVAFFLDFRNYVQHVELPIGNIHKSIRRDSVSIAITQDAQKLLKSSSRWPLSKLKAEMGSIDLISLTDEFYITFVQNFGGYVARLFSPELIEIDGFFRSLTNEVIKQYPNCIMGFLLENKHVRSGNKVRFTTTYSERPNYVFEELGISAQK